jgi:hypothetical protein
MVPDVCDRVLEAGISLAVVSDLEETDFCCSGRFINSKMQKSYSQKTSKSGDGFSLFWHCLGHPL